MTQRVRVYDARDLARSMAETFKDRPIEHEETLPFDWVPVLQHVGDSLAVAYSSDKWKPKGATGKRDWELYKHIAESRNRIFCDPGILRWSNAPGSAIKTIGPNVSFYDVPMPDSYAILALFKEANVRLHVGGSNSQPQFGKHADDGVLTLTVKHGLLGGSKIRWSKATGGRRKDQPFIFVYTEDDGPLFIILGEELDILKDGIVG